MNVDLQTSNKRYLDSRVKLSFSDTYSLSLSSLPSKKQNKLQAPSSSTKQNIWVVVGAAFYVSKKSKLRSRHGLGPSGEESKNLKSGTFPE